MRHYVKKYIVLHHSLTTRDQTAFAAVNNYHKQLWDFKSSLGFYCGYQYFIEADGKITQARADWEVGAHCKEARKNLDSIGICLAGNFDVEWPSEKQVAALRILIAILMAKHGITAAGLKFHRDYATYKTCPGKNMSKDFWQDILKPSVIPAKAGIQGSNANV